MRVRARQQHIGQNRECVASLDDAGDCLQRLEKRFTLSLKQVHFISLMMMMTSAFAGDNPVRASARAASRQEKAVGKVSVRQWRSGDKAEPSLRNGAYPQSLPQLYPAWSPFEYLLEHMVVAIDVVVFFPERRDGAACVKDGGVIPVAEGLADIGQAHLREVLGQRHGELTGPSDVTAAFLRV